MEAIERINEMSDDSLEGVLNAAINQNPNDHAPLYGVDFDVWVELLYSEYDRRGLTGVK